MKILKLNILPLLILIVVLGTSLSVQAQHGGKAEGRRVKFKPGTTSAAFTGKVSGSLEIEYELEAQAGQELIVRVVSEPPGSAGVKVLGPNAKVLEMSCLEAKQPESKKLGLPTAASHCPESNPEVLRREGRTWSATLPESGNFLLSVIRLPEGAKGVSTYSLLIIVPPAEKHSTSQPLSRADAASVETAMRKFIDALKTKDVAAFLSLFSRSRFFYANNPLNVTRITVPYSELENDLKKKEGWYLTYLGGGGLDAFIDNIGDGEMWLHVGGAKFVQPGSDAESYTYVKWRKEGGKWVIDEIAYPQA